MSANDSSIQYDIQGQVTTKGQVTPLQSERDAEDDYGRYAAFGKEESPAGEGPNLIPSTAPGTQDPQIFGQPLTDDQRTAFAPQGNVIKDQLNSAIDANAAGLKSMGVITESQADVNDKQFGVGVLGAAPSGVGQ